MPSSTKYSRPISLPWRTKNTCTQALVVVTGEGDHIRVDPVLRDDLLPLDDLVDRLQLIAQGRRPLVVPSRPRRAVISSRSRATTVFGLALQEAA